MFFCVVVAVVAVCCCSSSLVLGPRVLWSLVCIFNANGRKCLRNMFSGVFNSHKYTKTISYVKIMPKRGSFVCEK